MRIVRVNGQDPDEWLKVAGRVYVGRKVTLRSGLHAGKVWVASPLANPFRLTAKVCLASVLLKYQLWLGNHLERREPAILQAMQQLTSESVLGCWCYHNSDVQPGQPTNCHADIIAHTWLTHFEGNQWPR